ncbi:hypothetical protein diail_9752 [Diaporthe ilicicola]|nr:hypothetical protein diail_9752 [Diaporthe ilicicola]
MAPPKTDEPPKAANLDQTLNQFNLIISGLSRTLKTRSSSAANSKPQASGSEKPKSSISSLASKPSPQPSLKKPQQQKRKTFSQPRARDNEGDGFQMHENSGIGHVPASKEAAGDARAAETRDLKGKLLGKRALEQREEGRKKRARAKEDSSDEEEGRSAAVGKRSKKKGRE